ncbi:MAG: hypothetical protein R6X34_30310 [Chloroflexota bacterium]
MTTNRSWAKIPQTYRAREVSILVDWLLRGASGSVAGLPGVGKSNFLGFLCHWPEVVRALLAPHQIEAAFIPCPIQKGSGRLQNKINYGFSLTTI